MLRSREQVQATRSATAAQHRQLQVTRQRVQAEGGIGLLPLLQRTSMCSLLQDGLHLKVWVERCMSFVFRHAVRCSRILSYQSIGGPCCGSV